jgi:hypothetical protein
MSNASSKLFAPLRIGDMTLAHRIIMAPMTRLRANSEYVVGDATVEYYRQRSSVPGTFIISESVSTAAEAGGFPNLPGAYNDAQIQAWKKVLAASSPLLQTVTDPFPGCRRGSCERFIHLPPSRCHWKSWLPRNSACRGTSLCFIVANPARRTF